MEKHTIDEEGREVPLAPVEPVRRFYCTRIEEEVELDDDGWLPGEPIHFTEHSEMFVDSNGDVWDFDEELGWDYICTCEEWASQPENRTAIPGMRTRQEIFAMTARHGPVTQEELERIAKGLGNGVGLNEDTFLSLSDAQIEWLLDNTGYEWATVCFHAAAHNSSLGHGVTWECLRLDSSTRFSFKEWRLVHED